MKYIPENEKPGCGFEESLAVYERNFANLSKIDGAAKARGELLWRYMSEPVADGHAYYQIIKVGKTKVRIELCTGLGDDWSVRYWGHSAGIDRNYAEDSVKRRDGLAELFSKKEKTVRVDGTA